MCGPWVGYFLRPSAGNVYDSKVLCFTNSEQGVRRQNSLRLALVAACLVGIPFGSLALAQGRIFDCADRSRGERSASLRKAWLELSGGARLKPGLFVRPLLQR